MDYRLFRCAGCGRGALGVVEYYGQHYPSVKLELRSFYPEVKERLVLPKSVPDGVVKEFREGELCLEAGCFRAAAAAQPGRSKHGMAILLPNTRQPIPFELRPGSSWSGLRSKIIRRWKSILRL